MTGPRFSFRLPPEMLGLPLTPREWRTLALVADGLQNKEIAALTGTAASTVNERLTTIYAKLGATNRIEALLRVGWIVPGIDVQDFKDWLRIRLATLGLSQREAARRTGVDHSEISRLLSSDRDPSLDTVAKLARGLLA